MAGNERVHVNNTLFPCQIAMNRNLLLQKMRIDRKQSDYSTMAIFNASSVLPVEHKKIDYGCMTYGRAHLSMRFLA
ncbi:hypothetical protein KTT_36760 [Tengunoibacter tsumagoiensis]|uniref:Uncharacterized protein n=1 Tax=Tengunoibacter tsumagoiensis TaxID=2014871 RepID=A0A402A3U2_9CHLR|nr:hypothetical protein KTT_36760 [Tengunoibacter tsumagoiensis]